MLLLRFFLITHSRDMAVCCVAPLLNSYSLSRMKVTAEWITCAPLLTEIKSDATQVEMLTTPDTPRHLNFKKAKGDRNCSRERGNSGEGDYGSEEWFSPLWPSPERALTGADPSKINSYSAKQVVFELRNQPWNEIIRNKHQQMQQ